MECSTKPDSGWLPFRNRIYQRSIEERIPLHGSIEITSACNLKCVHCYITECHLPDSELSTAELKGIIDQLADEGCLWLLITGGEPLVREDFGEIYRYVKRCGIIPMLFTNGTLITDETADLLAQQPPHLVEVTLYGATEKTFESVTQVIGSFSRCIQGISRLLDRILRQ